MLSFGHKKQTSKNAATQPLTNEAIPLKISQNSCNEFEIVIGLLTFLF